jgi:hypothetical protein
VAGVDNNHDGQADDVNGDGVVDDSDRNVLPPTTLIRDAHAVGLLVHTWTFRNERQFLGRQYGENPSKEYLQFYAWASTACFQTFRTRRHVRARTDIRQSVHRDQARSAAPGPTVRRGSRARSR